VAGRPPKGLPATGVPYLFIANAYRLPFQAPANSAVPETAAAEATHVPISELHTVASVDRFSLITLIVALLLPRKS
jgi:hypothetical protein